MTVDALLILVRKLERRIASMVSIVSAASGISQLTGEVTAGPGTGAQAATIANDAVTNAKLANMADSTIKGRAVGAGTGDPQDLTANQTSTILDLATDPFLRTSAAGSPGITQLTGDVTAGPGTGSQAATIAANAVSDTKLRDSVALSVIGRSANSTGDPADIAAASDHQVLRRSGTAIGFGAVNLAQSAAVTGVLPLANLAARTTSVELVFGDGTNVIATGETHRFRIPVGITATLTRVYLMADQSGSITFDIRKDTWANYPPASGDSIINVGGGGTKPALSSDDNMEDSTLTQFTTSFSGGDVVYVVVEGTPATITECNVGLTFSF
jgi:hypothetical protein